LQEFLISNVHARMVLDSRGRPTVEVEVRTHGGGFGRAIAPAGASKGRHEALELRDGGREFRGYGVRKAVENVNRVIRPKLVGLDSRNQKEIDYLMCKLDGTPNKSKLGANAIVATSLAVAKAAASTARLPLYRYLGGPSACLMPVPMLNIINGGVHAGNELAFQEFMIVPVGADKFSEALRIAVEVYYELKDVLKKRYGALAVNVGDEGGFAPPMKTSREALDALMKAIEGAGYSESEVVLALDVAASQIYRDGKYYVDGMSLDVEELLEYYLQLFNEYPIKSVEDPFMEEDYEHFRMLTAKVRGKVLIVGDDLYTTNPLRLKRGIEMGATTAILVKVNQIGTLTETLQVVDIAHKAGMRTIISHRSGETEDTTIAHLAVAVRSGLIKTGAPARGERTAKYNELLRIEEELGGQAEYPGANIFKIMVV